MPSTSKPQMKVMESISSLSSSKTALDFQELFNCQTCSPNRSWLAIENDGPNSLPIAQDMPMFTCLPNEIILEIILYLSNPSDILAFALINKSNHQLTIDMLYKNVQFHSLKQRNAFIRDIVESKSESSFQTVTEDTWLQSDDSAVELSSTLISVPRRLLDSIRGIDFGLDINEEQYEWSNHFIDPDLETLCFSAIMHNLKILVLKGCQFRDVLLTLLLEKCHSLEHLDLSKSSVRRIGLSRIGESCRRLKILKMNGLFRLWRINPLVLSEILTQCKWLKRLEVMDCPDIFAIDPAKMSKEYPHVNIVVDYYK